MKNCDEFVCLLTKSSGRALSVYKETIDEWWPENPPVCVLFALLGDSICDEFANVDANSNREIFNLIEEAMDSNDQELTSAVATGLIEALVTRAAKKTGLWDEIAPLLGPLSRNHAQAWLS